MTDIPVRYGNPHAEWRFYKNEPRHKTWLPFPGKNCAPPSASAIKPCGKVDAAAPSPPFGEFSKLVFIKHRDEKNLDRSDGLPYAFQRRDGETAEQLATRVDRSLQQGTAARSRTCSPTASP